MGPTACAVVYERTLILATSWPTISFASIQVPKLRPHFPFQEHIKAPSDPKMSYT